MGSCSDGIIAKYLTYRKVLFWSDILDAEAFEAS